MTLLAKPFPVTSFPSKISRFPLIDSTMDEARRLIESGQSLDGELIWADEQSKGRGRQSRTWITCPGNFMGTIVLNPKVPASKAAEISFVTALAVGETVKLFIPNTYQIHYKWPNDVLVEGKKIAGILLEAVNLPTQASPWISIGIGINVQSHPENVFFKSTCINKFAKKDLNLLDIQSRLCALFEKYLNIWRQEGFSPIRKFWLKSAANLGKRINVISGENTITGKFIEIDSQGRLILEDESHHQIKILAGDVYFPEMRTKN